MDQHARRGALVEPVSAQIARAQRNVDQPVRDVAIDARLAHHDLGFDVGRRIVEIDRDEPLLGGFLQILDGALVAGL